jgi:hypothetical protein
MAIGLLGILARPAFAQRPVMVPAAASARPPMSAAARGATLPRAGTTATWSGPSTVGLQPPAATTIEVASGMSNASPWSILASAALPGAGQALQGVNRALPYLMVESFSWTGFVWYSTDARRQRDGYRDLAARIARAQFSATRPIGDFEYYERMSHYAEAGRYDLTAGGLLEPEVDSTTWNGAVWLLARSTYWADPGVRPDTASVEWKRAIAFYQERAYDQTFRWSWTGAPQEYQRFRDLIGRSNDAHRKSLQVLGLVIANHVLSAIDAYIVVRIRQRSAPGGNSYWLEGSLPMNRLRPGGR